MERKLSIQRSFASGSRLMVIFQIHLMFYLLECGKFCTFFFNEIVGLECVDMMCIDFVNSFNVHEKIISVISQIITNNSSNSDMTYSTYICS